MDRPPKTPLEDAVAKILQLRQEIKQLTELLEYYRQFAPDLPAIHVAPPGYFVHQTSNGKWSFGRLIDGQLVILEGGLGDETEAVAKGWNHLDSLSN